MLVVSRKNEEKILIGDAIVVHVLDIKHGRVRIGITAPRDVRVLRSELAGSDQPMEASVEPAVVRPAEELAAV